jgi:HK97 family phage prohead protease
MSKVETRTFRGTALRSSQGDEGSMVIAGRALSYNTLSGDLGGFKEKLQPGCFSRSIASGSDVLCRREHETGFLLGRTKNGTLTLQDGPDGLDFVCKIDPNDPIAVSTRAAIKSGLIDSMSFAFSVDGEDGQDFSGPDQRTGLLTRTIKRAALLDVAPVAAPAYPQGTSVQARKVDYSVVPVSDQTVVRAQIATFDAAQKIKCADTNRRARAIVAEYSPLSVEEIVRMKKLGYSEDLILELRGVAYAREIGGPTFEAGPMRYQAGQTEDPTDSLRADVDFGWDDDDWDADKHERAASYHRALASKAPSVEKGVQHFKAADLHSAAARLYPDLNSSFAARAASKSLRREKENCL